MTPTLFARIRDFMPEWREALKAAGYDPDAVIAEDARQRHDLVRKHGAQISAIDAEPAERKNAEQERISTEKMARQELPQLVG
jgi:hypothetical protein